MEVNMANIYLKIENYDTILHLLYYKKIDTKILNIFNLS